MPHICKHHHLYACCTACVRQLKHLQLYLHVLNSRVVVACSLRLLPLSCQQSLLCSVIFYTTRQGSMTLLRYAVRQFSPLA